MVAPVVTKDEKEFSLNLERDGVAIFDCNELLKNGKSFTEIAESVPWILFPETAECSAVATLAPTEIKMRKREDASNGKPSAVAVTYDETDQSKGTRHSRFGLEIGNKSKVTNETIDPCHADGAKAYGYNLPDYIFLLCEAACEEGGDNFCIDLRDIVNSFRTSGDLSSRWVADGLATKNVLQRYYSVTAAGKGEWSGPLVKRTKIIDRSIHTCPNVFTDEQRIFPVENETEVDKVEEMIKVYSDQLKREQNNAERFRLKRGHVLCVDNYRMAHGRDPYDDLNRTLWRTWLWTTHSNGLPRDLKKGKNEKKDSQI